MGKETILVHTLLFSFLIPDVESRIKYRSVDSLWWAIMGRMSKQQQQQQQQQQAQKLMINARTRKCFEHFYTPCFVFVLA